MRRKLVLLLLSLILSLALLEGLSRAFLPATPLHPPEESDSILNPHQEPRTNMRKIETSEGETRNITIKYYRNGFKRWGKTDTNRTKVLILGDSYTAMNYVSNGEEWYSYLEEAFPHTEFFVLGLHGSSTLKQFLALNQTWDQINPDLILWQFCRNDFAGIHYGFKKFQWPFNGGGIRPFLINGDIQYKLPSPLTEIRRNFKSIDYLLWIYHVRKVREINSQPDLQDDIHSKNINYVKRNPHIKKEMEAKVQDVLRRADKKTGKTPIYMFYVNETSALPPMGRQFREICDMGAINCIEGFNMYMERKQEKLDDRLSLPNLGHWNREGNRMVGEFLVEYFQNNSILEPAKG